MVANAIIKWPRREFKKKIKYSSGIIHQQRQKKKEPGLGPFDDERAGKGERKKSRVEKPGRMDQTKGWISCPAVPYLCVGPFAHWNRALEGISASRV